MRCWTIVFEDIFFSYGSSLVTLTLSIHRIALCVPPLLITSYHEGRDLFSGLGFVKCKCGKWQNPIKLKKNNSQGLFFVILPSALSLFGLHAFFCGIDFCLIICFINFLFFPYWLLHSRLSANLSLKSHNDGCLITCHSLSEILLTAVFVQIYLLLSYSCYRLAVICLSLWPSPFVFLLTSHIFALSLSDSSSFL